MFGFGTSAVFEEMPVSARSVAALSRSPIVKGSAAVALFSLTVWLAIAVSVGNWFAKRTWSTKLALVLPPSPSVTASVMSAAPI